jgi:hypothetical protein
MALPPQDNDPRPVVLQEPERDLAPAWQTTANKGFVLRPEEEGVPGLHPGWAQVLAPGETVLWHGAAVKELRQISSLATGALSLVLFAAFGLMLLQASQIAGFAVFLMFVVFVGLNKLAKRTAAGLRPSRSYLLTNRSAYLAHIQGASLFDIRAFPITPTMQLGLGPHSVAFATRRNDKGEEEAEGFLDINDAAAVHAMIRDVQTGLA